MQQLANITYFLPCIVSLVWLFIYSFRVKVITQRLMMAMLLLCIFYFASYAFYITPNTDYHAMAMLDMFNVPVILSLAAVNLLFVYTHHSTSLIHSRWQVILFIPVFIVSSANFLLYYIIGVDGAAEYYKAFDQCGAFPAAFESHLFRLFYQINNLFLNYLLLAYILFTLILCAKLSAKYGYRFGEVFRFFFKKNQSKPIRVICFLEIVSLCLLAPLAGLGRTFMIEHPGIGSSLSILLSGSLFCLFYVEYMINIPEFTLSSLSHVQVGNMPDEAETAQTISTTRTIEKGKEEDAIFTNNEEIPLETGSISPTLISNLKNAFDQEKIFLDPEISIQKLAAHLSTNRTTLSAAVSQTYGVNFRQLVARYRIEAAKNYMVNNPEAKQDLVAAECGFGTAQAFNQKFKEVVGDSPRMWIIKHSTDKI